MSSPTDTPDRPAESSSPLAEGAKQKDGDARDPGPPRDTSSPRSQSPSPSNESSELESGEERDDEEAADREPRDPEPRNSAPAAAPLPPLPREPAPEPGDDGWEYHWVPANGAYWFYNRFTGVWQQENPRVPGATSGGSIITAAATVTTTTPTTTTAEPPGLTSAPGSVAGGYNPAIHGDYNPNAWYAQASRVAEQPAVLGADPSALYVAAATGVQVNEAAKSERRPPNNSFFDVDAAANAHDGRSLKAERAGKKPSKAELKAFKEKRRARKEEKRRAWLRD